MRKLLLLSAVLLTLTIHSHAQQGVIDTTLVIKFDSLVYDYGTILKGSNGLCEFVFKNAGKTPLIVNNVSASCGCTVPEWTREPVEPGKTGIVKVKYNTMIVSPFTKSVSVISNAKNSPLILIIKGTVTEQAIQETK